MLNSGDPTANIISGISAGVAFLSMVIAAVTLWFAKRAVSTSTEATSAAKQSALAADRSAVAAERSIGIAERSATASEKSADAAKESVAVAEQSVVAAEKAITTTKEIAKRQGVIDLHLAWRDIGDIDADPGKIISEDVRRGVNALDLTASLWNHDVLEKEILFQSYWIPYKKIFDRLDSLEFIPDLGTTGKALLSGEIRRVYEEMKRRELEKLSQSEAEPNGH
jgi:hypothetical protein